MIYTALRSFKKILKKSLTKVKKDPVSIDGVAERLGYKSSSSLLKPYDERMLKAIIILNNMKIRRTSLFFDDLYGILFDEATPRRFSGIYHTALRVIK